jgi:ArsR family transcriptional regulator, virulence genes transcriptional regulator
MQDSEFYCMHSEMCKTLASAKRQQILDALRDGEVTVGEVVSRTGMTQANVSQHLALMRSKGLLTSRREGAYVYYAIANPKIMQAFDLITEVMREQLAKQNQTASGDTPAEEPTKKGRA